MNAGAIHDSRVSLVCGWAGFQKEILSDPLEGGQKS